MDASQSSQPPTRRKRAGFYLNEATNSIEAVGAPPILEPLGQGTAVLVGCDGLVIVFGDFGSVKRARSTGTTPTTACWLYIHRPARRSRDTTRLDHRNGKRAPLHDADPSDQAPRSPVPRFRSRTPTLA